MSAPVTVPADPAVAVTLGQIYTVLLETRDTVLELKTKVEALSPKVEVDHETRIRTLERKLWWLAGGAAAVGAFGDKIVAAIGM